MSPNVDARPLPGDAFYVLVGLYAVWRCGYGLAFALIGYGSLAVVRDSCLLRGAMCLGSSDVGAWGNVWERLLLWYFSRNVGLSVSTFLLFRNVTWSTIAQAVLTVVAVFNWALDETATQADIVLLGCYTFFIAFSLVVSQLPYRERDYLPFACVGLTLWFVSLVTERLADTQPGSRWELLAVNDVCTALAIACALRCIQPRH